MAIADFEYSTARMRTVSEKLTVELPPERTMSISKNPSSRRLPPKPRHPQQTPLPQASADPILENQSPPRG